MITQHHSAVLLNKHTLTREFSSTPIQVPCSLRYSSWAVEGIVVTGNFRRAPDPSCSYFTVANVHLKNECAKRRSVCIDLLLLIRDLRMKLGAVILPGDFYKGAERELAASAPTNQTSGERSAMFGRLRGLASGQWNPPPPVRLRVVCPCLNTKKELGIDETEKLKRNDLQKTKNGLKLQEIKNLWKEMENTQLAEQPNPHSHNIRPTYQHATDDLRC